MKLPKLLRDANLKISIVFYLHIPFPTSQVREGKRRKMIRSEIGRIDEESKMLGEEEKGKEEESRKDRSTRTLICRGGYMGVGIFTVSW